MGTQHRVSFAEALTGETAEQASLRQLHIRQALYVLITRCVLAVLFSTVFCVALVYLLMGGDMTRTGVTLLMSGLPALFLIVSK